MPVISLSTKTRIISLWKLGLSERKIVKQLELENRGAHSKNGVHVVITKFRETGSLENKLGRGRKSVIQTEHRDIICKSMDENNERTSADLQRILIEKTGVTYNTSTLKRTRRSLGWVATKARYCQLVRIENCKKRVLYAKECLAANEQFEDVIFTDECTVAIESNTRLTFRRVGHFRDFETPERGSRDYRGQPLIAKPKHPAKLHVWAGISRRGATDIVIFDGIMRKEFYVEEILQNTLKPFLMEHYPTGHRFMQDNDPKHTSRLAKEFMEENGINWAQTPAESPDMNPIEKIWHEMKHYLRKYVKPKNIDELAAGILKFWEIRVTVEKCQKYVSNLRKVVPEVIRRGGRATGY